MTRLQERYQADVAPALMQDFGYKNKHQIPRLEKIVVNAGVGEAVGNARALELALEDLRRITGQEPVMRRAKKSIAGFKLREGMPIGASVTLRRQRMYEFLDRLISVALPRVRDFKGLPRNSFDGRGNYSLGIKEQIIFPEIDLDKTTLRGLSITFVTTAETDDEGRKLLERFGMPFRKAKAEMQ